MTKLVTEFFKALVFSEQIKVGGKKLSAEARVLALFRVNPWDYDFPFKIKIAITRPKTKILSSGFFQTSIF